MSRGPGYIEGKIAALFTANPTATFSTGELVAAVYPEIKQVAKKHRVAVLRAATKVAARLGNWEKWKCERWGHSYATDRGVIFVNVCDVHSYALGRMRAEDMRLTPERMKERTSVGGMWWMFVQKERVARGAVLDAKTQRLVKIAEAEQKKSLRNLSKKLKGIGR